jgi:hypothetical protein
MDMTEDEWPDETEGPPARRRILDPEAGIRVLVVFALALTGALAVIGIVVIVGIDTTDDLTRAGLTALASLGSTAIGALAAGILYRPRE